MPGSRNLPGALDRDTLRQLFEELADELARARVRACIYIIGGAGPHLAGIGVEADRENPYGRHD